MTLDPIEISIFPWGQFFRKPKLGSVLWLQMFLCYFPVWLTNDPVKRLVFTLFGRSSLGFTHLPLHQYLFVVFLSVQPISYGLHFVVRAMAGVW